MPDTLAKSNIVNAIQRENGCSRKIAIDWVESPLEPIKTTLAFNEDVMVVGFGKFCV